MAADRLLRTGRAFLTGLAQIHTVRDAEERRALWRQGMASLAACAMDREPAPLEGLPPDALLESVRAATQSRLLADLGFLSPSAAAVALLELATALPSGQEKRELGRRTLHTLHEGDAPTFVALATALALSSRRPLQSPAERARVALAFELPASAGTAADALALALLSRRDLEREWLTLPSTGSLPSRRLAARLLERAAREATRRLVDGDESGLGVFGRVAVRDAWTRLLLDREQVVTRHVAIARGLLAHAQPLLAREIDRDLAPALDFGRWRRAATSLGAAVGADRAAVGRCREMLASSIVARDPGVTRALMFGLGAAVATEPEAAEALAAELVSPGGLEAVEAIVEVRRELDRADVFVAAAEAAERWLIAALRADDRSDDGRTALLQALLDEIAAGPVAAEGPLAARLREARACFVSGDSGNMLRAAHEALAAATDAVAALEQTGEDDPADRRHAFRVLRELDQALLETGALAQLLALEPEAAAGTRGTSASTPLRACLERLEDWLLAREAGPPQGPHVGHFALRIGRLRALVRLMDAESLGEEDTTPARRERRLRVCATLLERVRADRSNLRRGAWAALARAWDGLVRDELVELSDMLLGLTSNADPDEDFAVLREATMNPDIERIFQEYVEAARLARTARELPADDNRQRPVVAAFLRLAKSLPPATSARVEALRTAVLRVARALELCAEARSLSTLHPEALERLAGSVQVLAQLQAGAARRHGREPTGDLESDTAVRLFGFAVERLARGLSAPVDEDLEIVTSTLRAELPPAASDAVLAALARLAQLPLEAPTTDGEEPRAPTPVEPTLPSWLPPSRIIGGFYLIRPIGNGAGGSVFVAARAEERHDEHAEHFALKVPDYDGGAARNLSEDEFEALFREEARALLALPAHPNIATFVTFDARAKPKPLLVMELVQGASLEHVLQSASLDMDAALAIIDGIAAGLCAMHEARVAHLDIKPANIILRAGEGDGARTPVLVDFGLAGRKLRAGCGSPHYGAPEVWSQKLADVTPTPFPADAYAFASLAYELLTGHVLVTGESMIAVVAAHIAGTAGREQLSRLAAQPGLGPLAELLVGGLAREAERRLTMPKLRAGIAALAPTLRARPWPLPA